jgi:hypothetical protein
LIRGKLVIRRDDDGNEGNRLTRFEYVGVEAGDAFEPKDDLVEGNATEPDPSFGFGTNATPPTDPNPPEGNAEPPSADGARPKRSRKKADGAEPEGGANS